MKNIKNLLEKKEINLKFELVKISNAINKASVLADKLQAKVYHSDSGDSEVEEVSINVKFMVSELNNKLDKLIKKQ